VALTVLCLILWCILHLHHESSLLAKVEVEIDRDQTRAEAEPLSQGGEGTDSLAVRGVNQPSTGKGAGASVVPVLSKGEKTWHPYISRTEPYPLNKNEIGHALIQLRNGKTPSIRIKLFEHGYKTLVLANDEKIDPDIRGFSMSGSFDGHPGSVGVISSVGDSYAGVALVPNVGYFRIKTIQDSGSASIVIEEITKTGGCACNPLSADLGGGEFQTIIPQGLRIASSQAVAEAPAPVFIGVSFGYTLQASSAADSELTIENPSGTASSSNYSGIEASLTAALGYANQVHRQSGSVARFYAISFNLLPRPEISNESLLTTRNAANPFKASYDSIRFGALTTAASNGGADISMVVISSPVGLSGIAYAPSKDLLYPDRTSHSLANSVGVVSTPDLEVTLTHELAHFFGCAHDVDNAFGDVNIGPTEYAQLVKDAAVGSRFLYGRSSSKKEYGTIMSYTPGGRYLPYFSNPRITLFNDSSDKTLTRVGGGSVSSLGLNGPASAGGANNVECINTYARTVANYGDGKTIPSSLVSLYKTDHWAHVELQKCIDLGIMNNQNPVDRVWVNAEKPVTRGEMITLLKTAVEKSNSSYFHGSPFHQPPGSYNPFPQDDETRNSSHWSNVRLFAYNGLLSSSNSFFYVNNNATIGEMVLFARKVFNLGADGGNTEAVPIFEYWRSKFRGATFQRPATTGYSFFVAYGNGSALNQPLSQSSGQSWLSEAGILDLEYNTSEGDLHNKGYSVPARRAVFAKMLINLLHWKATPLNRRSM
jgi:hypothetical protein